MNYETGFFHLASAMMAIDHFNERNPTIVPELAEEQFMRDCPVQIDYNLLQVIDTDRASRQQSMMAMVMANAETTPLPNAIAGPTDDLAAMGTSRQLYSI